MCWILLATTFLISLVSFSFPIWRQSIVHLCSSGILCMLQKVSPHRQSIPNSPTFLLHWLHLDLSTYITSSRTCLGAAKERSLEGYVDVISFLGVSKFSPTTDRLSSSFFLFLHRAMVYLKQPEHSQSKASLAKKLLQVPQQRSVGCSGFERSMERRVSY